MKQNKDGTAHWEQGDVVEVNITLDHDPNIYYAMCQTSGTYPRIEVYDARYPLALQGKPQDSPFVILRLLSPLEAQLALGDEPVEAKTYAVNLLRGGPVEVLDTRKKTKKFPKGLPVEQFQSIDLALAWIKKRECAVCGLPLLESSVNCSAPHFGEEDTLHFDAF